MKNFKIKWLLLSFILSIASINQMWAKDIFIDLNEAPYWYTKPEVKYLKGGNYITESASSTDISKIYKATVPDDVEAWEVCRDGGNNNIGWHTEDAKNRCRVYDTGSGGLFKQIVGLVTGGYIYFDNSVSNFTGTLYFVIGHDHNYWNADNKYTIAYEMTNLSGTSLYYVAITDDWSDAEFYAVVGSNLDLSGTGWGSDDIDDKGNKGYTAAYTGPYNLTEGQTYYITTASSGNNKAMTITWKDGYSNIPKNNMTIDVRTKVTGGSYGTSFNAPTSVYAQARQLTNNGTITAGNSQKATASGSTKSATIADVTTGQVNFSYTALDNDAQWAFDGWGTSNSTVSSTNSTYRIDAGSAASKTATTIYAFFTRKPVLTVNCGDNGTSASGSATNNAKTSYSLSATAADGYRFKVWTVGSGSVTFSDNTSATSTATISADATITATFEEIPAGQLEVVAGSNGKVKIDGEASWTSDSYSYTDITSDGDYNIYAQANDHYHFVNWTKSGDGTIKTNAASGVYTMTANGVGTVTANFAETQHDVTVQYRCGTAVIKSNTTASNVGEVTPSSQAAPAIDGYTFSAWTIESGITKTSGALTDGTLYFKTNSSGTYTITANYTAKACSLVKLSAGKNGGETTTGTDAGAMTFDPTTKAYYKDITTTASPYYFRFTYNSSTKYCSDWKDDKYAEGKEVAANTEGSKVTCDQSVGGWTDKPAMYYSGAVGSKLRVWFDYQNKKVWTTASLNEQFVLRGSKYDNSGNGGMPGWDATTSYFSGLASGSSGTKTVTLEAGVKYKVKAYDMFTGTYKGKSSAGEQEMANNTYYAVGSGGDFYFTSTAAGTYTFTYHTSSGLKVQFPVSYTVNFNAETFLNGGASHSTSTTGGTVAAVDGNETTFTSGSKIISGGTVVITATKHTGYDFDGFFTNANCTTEVSGAGVSISDNVLTFSSINEAKTAYAKFSEKMTTVTITANNKSAGSVTVGGVDFAWDGTTTAGVTTTRALVATAAPGYYFSGWTRSDGADFHLSGYGEANTSVTLTGDGAGETSGQTLTANFTELNKIYFRNIFDDGNGNVTRWSRVYVGYSDHWDNSTNCNGGPCGADTYGCATAEMTRIGESDVYWAYVPRGFTTSNATTVLFFDYDMSTWSHFNGHNAARRSDYKNALNMFVPYHTKSQTVNETDYYSNGYWMKYDTKASEGAGYYLKKYNSRNNYTQEGEFYATNDDATFIQFSLRIDASDSDRDYMITSSGGLNYLASSKVTSANNSDIVMNEDLRTLTDNDVKFTIHTTSEGYYTFVIDQSGDKMKLNVIYPVSVGDYKLVHDYNDGSAKSSHSDVIKAADASGKTVSMYLNMDAGTKSLKLYKCTAITNGYPVWGSSTTVGTGTGLFNTTTFNKGKGVYVFDVAIEKTGHTVTSISNAGLYTGDFYIKTDCAPGGWANYTQNILDKNTINATAAGFDYYMCKWIGNSTTNVKCVIANDYNNEITDTLKSDAILTRSAIAYETLPEAANVRFSYDTKTNTLKRTYLLGSSMSEKFIYLVPNAADYVYSAATSGTDYYSSNPKFEDNGNWTYQMDAYVYPGAKAGVKTDYPKAEPITVQTLIDPTTNYLMGGTTKGSTRYPVRLVYDFKTDYLMSAYMPDGLPVTTSIDLQTDMMYVRSGEGASTQLSFSGSGELKNVKRAYGVFEFPKDQMSGQMSSWAANSYRAYKYCRYYFSFPFDVYIKDIFGVGEYGKEFIIQTYNGVKRAQIGWFMETDSFWETMDVNETLKANTGYSLMLDREEFNRSDGKGVWTNIADGKAIYLFFPSTSTTLGTIDAASGTFTVEEHAHTSGRTWTKDAKTLNHDDTDSNWGMIGLPAYASTYPNNGTKKLDKCYTYQPDGVNFNTWQVTDLVQGSSLLKSMHAYMVQYAGTFSWTTVAPSPIAARTLDTNTNMTIRLNLQYNGEEADRAFVKLQDGSDKGFVLNEDLYKMVNKGKTNIYVYAGDYDVAYSTTPVESQTIEVGVIIAKKGTYTFSMPEGINGTVTLIDTYTQTRTNLALEDYEVYLNKGTINDRFLLEIDVQHATTDVKEVTGDGLQVTGVLKYIYDSQLYIMKNGVIYDARGNRVK